MEIQIRGPFATGRTQPVIPIPDMIHIPLFCGIQNHILGPVAIVQEASN
jgi:hypothetical protein